MKDSVRIGCFAAFWGDTHQATRQLLGDPDGLDYLVSDYLAEITMALLARARAKDPEGGFVPDGVSVIGTALEQIAERGIKVVTNAGALNPPACARALEQQVADRGLELKVATVDGDDLLPRLEEILATDPRDMFTGERLPADVSSINAYLGARPVADALAAGADIVVTGRCVDAAVVLGPLLHEFGWSDEDYDLLAGGCLAGHLIECGPQCTGGIHTDWRDVPGWDDIGYPIAECRPDGTATITKPRGSGGMVTPGTVGEQMLYEIGDPGAYVMPDVICDWRQVTLTQEGPDRVAVGGARGSAPTGSYKVTATLTDGYRTMTTALFAGLGAAERARRAGEAAIARAERLLAERGLDPLAETSIEVVGGGDFGRAPEPSEEAVVKIGARHPDRAALELFASEYMSIGLVAQGMAGVYAGRPRVSPVFRVLHLLVPKDELTVRVTIDGESRVVQIAPGIVAEPPRSPTLEPGAPSPTSPAERTVPLAELAYARSGDKGNDANIGVIARRPEDLELLREQLTPARVAEIFARYLKGSVEGWELAGVGGFNFLLHDVLGGSGGTSTLRYDPQGKSYGAMLLATPIEVPDSWPEPPAAGAER